MEKEESSSPMAENEDSGETTATHQTKIPAGLTEEEFEELKPVIHEFHTYRIGSGKCSSLLSQRIYAPAKTVWSTVRRFDKPQTYKHFIKNCSIKDGDSPPPTTVGCLRKVNVISGLPAETSTERLDVLDDERKLTGFTIIGGEHRLRNYRSVTSLNEFKGGRGGGGGGGGGSDDDEYDDEKTWTVVLESYVVDVPEGNTEEDTRMFADTVVRLNLQKLASVTEGLARDRSR